jgi:hypothetical protein
MYEGRQSNQRPAVVLADQGCGNNHVVAASTSEALHENRCISRANHAVDFAAARRGVCLVPTGG